MKLTPILMVESVEASLAFWATRMRFDKVAEVPHEGGIGFAILTREGTELMLQSFASAQGDTGSFGPRRGESSALYLEVGDLEEVTRRLQGYPIELAERTTFYGMREIGVKEPGGHWVLFAARA